MSEIEFRLFQKINATFDTPAFCRRAAAVEEAWTLLLDKCQQKRNELLAMPRLRLATFFALVGERRSLAHSILDETELDHLEQLNRQWDYRLRAAVTPAVSERQLRGPLAQVAKSFNRFNHSWTEYIGKMDLSYVNHLRENYNRYYLIEKECALWSAKLAQKGFVPMKPAQHADLLHEFPLLQIPV